MNSKDEVQGSVGSDTGNTPELSRRGFIKIVGFAGSVVAANGFAFSIFNGPAEAAEKAAKKLPTSWNEEVDVVIVGTGFAGMAAAAEASSRGSKVLMIEKMPIYGGNSAINAAGFNSWTDKLNMREKLNLGSDSAEAHYKDTLKGGGFYGVPELVKTMVEGAPDALNWLIDNGAEFQQRLNKMGGHSGFRSHVHASGRGKGYVDVMKKIADANGTKLDLSTKLSWIWRQDPAGPILGVEVESPKGRRNIKIKKALILAAGGFSRDVKMRAAFNPSITADYNCTNQPGATGEVIRMAQAIGADALQLCFIQFFPTAEPKTGALDDASLIPNRIGAWGGIFINKAGKRFVNESGTRDEVARATMNSGGKPAYCIFTEKMIPKVMKPEVVDKALETGRIFKGNSIAEVVKKFELPEKAVSETVAQYIEYVKKGADPDFNQKMTKDMFSLAEGPYYIIAQWPSVHHTCGGLRINTLANVIDIWGQPIPKLYAAGEVAGGVQGNNRLGSNATPACIVFGRIAGTNASKEKA